MSSTDQAVQPLGRLLKITGFVALAVFGIWGCGRPAAEANAAQERARALERRCVQLEQDFRTVQQARDKARRDLGEAQTTISQQAEQLKDLAEVRRRLNAALADAEQARKLLAQRTLERDNLRAELSMRMSEREALTNRCEKLRKGLQSLLQEDASETGGSMAPASTAH
jgi:chromosome segregation ATPase